LYFTTFKADCSTLLYDTFGTTAAATIDCGKEFCVYQGGNRRSRKIVITYPINYIALGSITTVTPSSYYVNGALIEGMRAATRNTKTIIHEVSTATITPSEKIDAIAWNANWTREFIENSNAPNVIAGRNYEVTGTSSIVASRGYDFNVLISDPLQIQSGSRNIKGGITTITSSSFKGEAKVDFGNGDCDNHANQIYGKKEVELNLQNKQESFPIVSN
jgi:hypothetical protein